MEQYGARSILVVLSGLCAMAVRVEEEEEEEKKEEEEEDKTWKNLKALSKCRRNFAGKQG